LSAKFLVNNSVVQKSRMAHSNGGSRTNVTKVIQETLVKSASDEREYRALVLPNDLQVMLISDKEADKAAAALSVAVGNYIIPLHGAIRYS